MYQELINRQIYKGLLKVKVGEYMTNELEQWWKGLGEELETDIEALTDSKS